MLAGMTDGAATFVAVVPAVPTSARLLRRFLAHCVLLVDSDVDEADATLVLSELATNAIEYGQAETLSVALLFGPDSLSIEVTDGNPDGPIARLRSTDHTEKSRGLDIVEAVSRQWGWRAEGPGKTVWATVGSVSVQRRVAQGGEGDV
jgi:anti-sigma regulatory factor (Ser/Thr protein kinase)